MSSLTDIDKRYLEKLFRMGGGYVLDFTDLTFGEFFKCHKVDIHELKYQTFGTSKAKKLRAFWLLEPDRLVGEVLSEMLNSYEADCELNDRVPDERLLERARGIVGRLTCRSTVPQASMTETEFLALELAAPNIVQHRRVGQAATARHLPRAQAQLPPQTQYFSNSTHG